MNHDGPADMWTEKETVETMSTVVIVFSVEAPVWVEVMTSGACQGFRVWGGGRWPSIGVAGRLALWDA